MDDKLKKLMKELGDAINESLSESDEIAEVISRIKGDGYDVFLVLEATIGFNKRDEDTDEVKSSSSPGDKTEAEFRVNAQDLKFLRSLKISVEE